MLGMFKNKYKIKINYFWEPKKQYDSVITNNYFNTPIH